MSFSCIIMWPQRSFHVCAHACELRCTLRSTLTPLNSIYAAYITTHTLYQPEIDVCVSCAAVRAGLSGFGKDQRGHSNFRDRLVWFWLKRERRQEHQARTGIIVKCRPHGTSFFPHSVSVNITLPPITVLALSPTMRWFQCGPLYGKCNPNQSWSVTMRICAPFSQHDISVCVSVCQTAMEVCQSGAAVLFVVCPEKRMTAETECLLDCAALTLSESFQASFVL